MVPFAITETGLLPGLPYVISAWATAPILSSAHHQH